MEQATQKKYILQHLKRYGSIEPLEALREYGCYRLGAVIFKLRKAGLNIITERKEAVSKITGKPVHYARYILKEDGVQ